MNYGEEPFSAKTISFVNHHILIVYIAAVVTSTLIVLILQIVGVFG